MNTRNSNSHAFLGILSIVWITIIAIVAIWKIQESYNAGAIAHAEGRVAVTTLPDGSKVVTTVKENK